MNSRQIKIDGKQEVAIFTDVHRDRYRELYLRFSFKDGHDGGLLKYSM